MIGTSQIKLNNIFVLAAILSVVMILSSAILSVALKPPMFSAVEIFLYYISICSLMAIAAFMIIIGTTKSRFQNDRKCYIACLVGGVLICLIYGIGGAYKYHVFSGFLDDKIQIIDKAAISIADIGMQPDELCKYSLSLAKSIYYFKGDITMYFNCDGVALNFFPSDIDYDQRSQVVLIEKNATRAINTMVLFFSTLVVTVISSLGFNRSRKKIID